MDFELHGNALQGRLPIDFALLSDGQHFDRDHMNPHTINNNTRSSIFQKLWHHHYGYFGLLSALQLCLCGSLDSDKARCDSLIPVVASRFLVVDFKNDTIR
jgi:hypothetical protein